MRTLAVRDEVYRMTRKVNVFTANPKGKAATKIIGLSIKISIALVSYILLNSKKNDASSNQNADAGATI